MFSWHARGHKPAFTKLLANAAITLEVLKAVLPDKMRNFQALRVVAQMRSLHTNQRRLVACSNHANMRTCVHDSSRLALLLLELLQRMLVSAAKNVGVGLAAARDRVLPQPIHVHAVGDGLVQCVELCIRQAHGNVLVLENTVRQRKQSGLHRERHGLGL